MASANGSWNIDIASPLGVLTFVLDLAQAGNRVTGSAVGDLGEFVVQDGETTSEGVAFTVDDAPLPTKLALNLRVDGDSLVGTAKAGLLSASVTGTRATHD